MAQVTVNSHLVWDEAGPDLATVQSYTFKHYDDGGSSGVVFSGVVVTPGSTTGVFTCTALFPAFAPGSHTVAVSASDLAGESARSVTFSFTMVAIPAVPTNIRIS